MLRIIVLCVVGTGLAAAPASAQSRFYTGGIAAAESGPGGTMALGTFPAAGGLLGWRFTDAWSIEVHLDRGCRGRDAARTPRLFRGRYLAGPCGRRVRRVGHRGNPARAVASRPRSQWVYRNGASRRSGRSASIRTVNLPPDDPLLQNETGTTQAGGPTGWIHASGVTGWGMVGRSRAARVARVHVGRHLRRRHLFAALYGRSSHVGLLTVHSGIGRTGQAKVTRSRLHEPIVDRETRTAFTEV